MFQSPTKNQFIPVDVQASPLSKQGNLTGTPRKVRDSAADLYNYIQIWNGHHIQGVAILSQITELKLGNLNGFSESIESPNLKKLQFLCNELEGLCNNLKLVAEDIKMTYTHFNGLKKLEDMREVKSKPFLTWPIDRYVEISEEISRAYSKEVEVKFIVKENIAHVNTKEELLMFSALWTHQPYIENNVNYILEAMLKETGHR